MQWYYALSGRQVGPHSLEEMQALVRQGTVRRDTLIWASCLNNWQPAGQVAEFSVDWNAAPPLPPVLPASASAPGFPSPPSGHSLPRNPYTPPSGNVFQPGQGTAPSATGPLVFSIISTLVSFLFCCIPIGVVGIIYAAQINGKVAQGDLEGARRCASTANIWSGVSLGLGAVGLIITLVAFLSSTPRFHL